jgi:ubiquitin C-terminal hydrolase
MTRCPYEGDVLSMHEFFAPESEAAEQSWNYELRGVSDHHGTHMGGHYTAQFKHPISHQWWWMDDDRARQLENPQFSSSNYIFFFKKSN